MPEIQVPFLGSVSIVVLALPLLYGPLAIWIILRLAGVIGRPREESRLRRREDRTLLFWACPECHSVTPEPADVCYYCGARRLSSEQAEAIQPTAPAPAARATATADQPLRAPAPAARQEQPVRPARRTRSWSTSTVSAQRPATPRAPSPRVPVLRVVTPEPTSTGAIAEAGDIVAGARRGTSARAPSRRRPAAIDGASLEETPDGEEPVRRGRRVAG